MPTGLDNRRCNLRESNYIENAKHRHKNHENHIGRDNIEKFHVTDDIDDSIKRLTVYKPVLTTYCDYLRSLLKDKMIRGTKDNIRLLVNRLKELDILNSVQSVKVDRL